MKDILRCSAVFAAALAWYSCTPSGAPAPTEGAAELSGKTLDGKTVSLSDHKGKVVLVDFWATWCGPCQAEIPELVKLQDELGPKGFVVLGVSMDEDASDVAKFVKSNPFNYPVVLNGSERAPKGWVVPGLPTAYLVGRDGKVRKRMFGSKSVKKLAGDVEAALALK